MNGIQLIWNGQVLEPAIAHGTLATGEILKQNQALILTLHHGELKERPAVGAGISDMLLDHDPILWRTTIKEQLEMDGQTVKGVKITQTGIQIEAEYK